jgi:hypothetical protein
MTAIFIVVEAICRHRTLLGLMMPKTVRRHRERNPFGFLLLAFCQTQRRNYRTGKEGNEN